MPRTAEQTAQTRRRILAEAVRGLREGGARSVRVARVMHDAGLTHGGFYAHFPSREALLCEAIAQLAAECEPAKRLSRQPAAPALALADFLEHYLSTAHCERRPGACPTTGSPASWSSVALAGRVWPRTPCGVPSS